MMKSILEKYNVTDIQVATLIAHLNALGYKPDGETARILRALADGLDDPSIAAEGKKAYREAVQRHIEIIEKFKTSHNN